MKRLLKNTDKILLVLAIVMFIFGLLMVFSSSNAVAISRGLSPYEYFIKQLFFITMGVIGFFIIIRVPTKNYQKISKFVLIIIFIFLVYLLLFGESIRGVKGWIDLGFMTLQPSEVAKIALLMYIGSFYEKVIVRNKTDNISMFKPLAISGLVIFMTLAQPDLGTAIIIIGVVALTTYTIPFDKKIKDQIITVAATSIFLMSFVGLLAVTVGGVDISSKLERFNFLSPCERYQDPTGYQVCNGFIAINNGGLYGVGLGNSTQKYLYLPESHTDFIFPVILEEWGLIGGLIILLIYLTILYRIILISKRSITLRGSIIAYGVATYIFLHIAINLGGALGIMPLTGVPLPFLSYGGSSTLTLMIALSIVQRIEIERNLKIRENITKIIN